MGGSLPSIARTANLDGDGTPENIVVDRAMCTGDGNCYWNVFKQPPAGTQSVRGTRGRSRAQRSSRCPRRATT